jgi:hypothetical protein
MGLPGQESQDGTVRTGLPGKDRQDNQNRRMRTGQPEKHYQDKTVREKFAFRHICYYLQPIEMFAAETAS